MIPAVLGVITIPLDPVLLRLGPVGIHWYGIAYVVAFIVGIRLTSGYGRSHGFSEKHLSDIYWLTIAFGLVGGRLYFVIQQPNLLDYLRNPLAVVAVWNGGMAFFGAIVASVTTITVYCYRQRLPLWVALDGGALFATLPQAIGRVGNIINGDILGPVSNLPWAVVYTNPNSFAPHDGLARQPAGAYELLASLVLFALIWWMLRRNLRAGTAIIVYLAAYAVSQLLLFNFRATEPALLFGLKQAQLTSIVFLVVVVPVVALLRNRFPDAFTDAARRERPAVKQAVEAS